MKYFRRLRWNKIRSLVPFYNTLEAAFRRPLARLSTVVVPVDQIVGSHAHHKRIHEARTVGLVAQNVAVFDIVAHTVFVSLNDERHRPSRSAGPLNDFLYHLLRYAV